MTVRHIDEVRCTICKEVFPDESDLIDFVWLKDEATGKSSKLGYFCEFCRPPAAELVGGSFLVKRRG